MEQKSVRIREVSIFQGLNCMQELFLGKEKMSLLESIHIHREGFQSSNSVVQGEASVRGLGFIMRMFHYNISIIYTGTFDALVVCVGLICNVMLENPPRGPFIPYKPHSLPNQAYQPRTTVSL